MSALAIATNVLYDARDKSSNSILKSPDISLFGFLIRIYM
jgi:hypothetical protein